ncbi:hypothetical protein H257_12357 [Aphanomyces astaci]|uniref:Uncharacterized protein n=1 Tax=Aphanomyces astaci TaxID=112090 RepID=W4G0Q6_APHAT|nr:hypothetical protein H257_12357 [Aphanomyces astaci]ETV72599.1 hypothetical protein H257_12357 [Aphanomyces astaci]|eukprot:XP_009837827.1 hypothetical protein H257_12357 [Aphanomyces astaci]
MAPKERHYLTSPSLIANKRTRGQPCTPPATEARSSRDVMNGGIDQGPLIAGLITFPACIHVIDAEGRTALDVGKNLKTTVATDMNQSVAVVQECGRTLLAMAAMRGNVEIVQEALDHGAKVNAPDDMGNSPLHLAVMNGMVRVVRRLASLPKCQLSTRTVEKRGGGDDLALWIKANHERPFLQHLVRSLGGCSRATCLKFLASLAKIDVDSKKTSHRFHLILDNHEKFQKDSVYLDGVDRR